jgi:hypothetical protein
MHVHIHVMYGAPYMYTCTHVQYVTSLHVATHVPQHFIINPSAGDTTVDLQSGIDIQQSRSMVMSCVSVRKYHVCTTTTCVLPGTHM